MSKWTLYSGRPYQNDLQSLWKRLGPSGHMRRGPKEIQLCDCNPGHIRSLLEMAGIRNQDEFSLNSFFQTTLLAAVQAYDPANLTAYSEGLNYRILLGVHGSSGRQHPQFWLMMLDLEKPKTLALFREAATVLLPDWFSDYADVYGEEAARLILLGLSDESDLILDFQGHVSRHALLSFRESLRKLASTPRSKPMAA